MIEHNCRKDPGISEAWGTAIDCVSLDGEKLWVGNGEYSSEVYFCPWCGKSKEDIIKDGS